ncbi:hypothetical protein SKAU_G00031670 [Synaphobranchus kaupii]|uniref:Rab-GAP TBC domain-containing protein n=1 Tax=Synaphobranchus kaupii TaxID=118154 RepID=A0A9Q1GF71_SYNKA|nr:hypothetical protein SKAU_G00031670 [Synaphobranchus kaupii]
MEPMSTQVDPNSEDSSGSDTMSLLSVGVPATETDRFGFILGTGSTVGTEGPPPEVVRQRETKWLNIISQWDRILLKKTNKVKEQCRKGIPASLRARCWPLLCRAMERMNKNKTLYQTLDSSPALQSWVDVIERDIDRQFPFHEMFLSRDGHGQQGLFRVLKAYTQFRPDEGYCQGQGPVAAVLLMNMPAEEAFWCLVQISEQYLPGYYSPLLEGVLFDAGVLSGVLRRACPSAHRHLHKHGVEPLMFATDWLMCLYTRHLPFNTLLRVWDLFFCYGVRVLFQVAVALVRRALGRQDQREDCEGQMETLERLRGIKAQVPQEDNAFIEEVCSVPLSGRDLERETERELERWRKERPSSTFDPRRRCHGYRAAWVKGRETEDQRERAERERGNLSLPLLRSPSSLSPSLLRKRWKRASRTEAGEREGGGAEAREREKRAERCRREEEEEEAQRDTAGHRVPLECPSMSMAEPYGANTSPVQGHMSGDRPKGRVGGCTQGGGANTEAITYTMVRPSPETPRLAVSTETNPGFDNTEGSAMLNQAHTDFPEGPGGSTEPGTTSRTSTVAQQRATEAASGCPQDRGDMVESPEIDFEQKDGVGACKETAERSGGTAKPLIGSEPEHTDEDCSTKATASNQNLGIQEPQGSDQPTLSSPGGLEPSNQLPVNQGGSLGNGHQGEKDSSGHSGGEISEQLEDSGTLELQGEHSSDTAQTGLPANHSPAGDHTAPQQGEVEEGNQPGSFLLGESRKIEQAPNGATEAGQEGADQSLSPTGCGGSPVIPMLDQVEESGSQQRVVSDPQLPTRALSITEAVPFGFAHCQDSTAGPTSETLPDDRGGVSEHPPSPLVWAGQTEGEGDARQEEAQPTGTDPTTPGCDLVSPEDQGGSGETSPSTGPCPGAEKGNVVYRQRRTPCGRTPRSRTLSEDTFRDPNHGGSETIPTNGPSDHPPQNKPYDSSHQEETNPHLTSDPSLQEMNMPHPPSDPSHRNKTKPHLPSDPSLQDKTKPHPPSDPSHQEMNMPHPPSDPSHRNKTKPHLPSDPSLQDKTKPHLPSDPSHRNKTKPHPPSNPSHQEMNRPHPPSDPSHQEMNMPHPQSDPSHQDISRPLPESNQVDTPRRFALFRMLRGDRPKNRRGGDGGGMDKKASSPKMTVPTILIQDFSDGVGPGVAGAESRVAGDGLSSKERRQKRREQERREREEEKARKKREKEMEKEKGRERKKPQTRGKSFHAHSGKCDVSPAGNNSSKTPGSKRNSAPFFDTYF